MSDPWDRSPEADAWWDTIQRVWQAILAVVALGIVWSWSTGGPSFPVTQAERAAVTVLGAVPTPTFTDPARAAEAILVGQVERDRTVRAAMAERLAERRQHVGDRGDGLGGSGGAGDSDGARVGGDSSGGGDSPSDPGDPPRSTTTTTRPWRPADECARVPNPGPVWLTDATMRWCPMVAEHLAKYEWNPGDLYRLLLTMECESNGDPGATNPSSGTAGLYQHRPRYWADRSRAAGLGPDADPYDPHDNIHVAVWLLKTRQPFEQAWDGCWAKGSMWETWRNR